MKIKKTSAGLAPFVPSSDNPWDEKRALHLLRRTSYCATPVKARALLDKSPSDVVDQLVDEAMNLPVPGRNDIWNTFPPPPDASADVKAAFVDVNNEATDAYKKDIVSKMVTDGLREKMAFIWSDHLVTTKGIVFYLAFMDDYWNLLRKHALGNYKQFVYDIGLAPSMLRYLNGNQNLKDHPNENYGRELLELFTMGVGHYTQDDILEASRALTGWKDVPETYEVIFRPIHFDDGEKTIFGRTGNWGYDDLIDIVFEERGIETARYTVRKIYESFVYAEPDEDIIEELAQIMVDNSFELEPVVRTLLKSEHFFDLAFVGARIKEPIELYTSLIPILSDGSNGDVLLGEAKKRAKDWGQDIMDGPNVAGWDGDRAWLSSGTFLTRWQHTINAITDFSINKEELLSWTTDRSNPYTVASDLAKAMLPYDIKDPDLEMFGDIFLGSIPDYEWNPDSDNAVTLLERYVKYIIQLPSFQLS